jgi:hypothetical protein
MITETLYKATFAAGYAVIGLAALFFLGAIASTVIGKVIRWRERRRDKQGKRKTKAMIR